MKADKKQRVCKYFNFGYCKFKTDCKYTHPKVNCAQIECKNIGGCKAKVGSRETKGGKQTKAS